MVSFASIPQAVQYLIIASCLMMSTSEAAPVAGNRTLTDLVSFTLPPIISDRVIAPKVPAVNHNKEKDNIAKNLKWYREHGGKVKIGKRDGELVGGMTMDLPADAPPTPPEPAEGSVYIASASEIAEFKKYAGIAATAYCRDVVPGTNWDCTQCQKYAPDGQLIKTFTSLITDTNGFVLRSDSQKTIYLVFRGTNSIRSAITDLVFDLTDYAPVAGAKVHKGFLASYKEVVNKYFPVIQDELTAFPTYKIIVTGHSLGGAQALLAALDLYQRDKRIGPNNLSIFTVGAPRVGNPTFAYYVDSTDLPFSRSVNDRDIVPHVPPQAFGYLHAGVEAWARTSTHVQICNSQIETGSCSNSIVPFTSFTDHLTYYGINEGLCL